jgi:hypothetical protein
MKQSFDIEINKYIHKKSVEIMNKKVSEIKNRKNKFLFESAANGHRKSPDSYRMYLQEMEDKALQERLKYIRSKKVGCINSVDERFG